MRSRAAAAVGRAGSMLGVGGGRWSPDHKRASWARPLPTLDDAVEPFGGPLAGYADPEGRLPGAVLTPSFRSGRAADRGRKVVLSPPGEIHVLEDGGGAVSLRRIAVDRIDHVRVGTVLLRSWIEVGGTDDDGGSIEVQFEFNTVTHSLFSGLLQAARSGAGPGRGDARAAVEAAAELPRKFGGYAARSVAAGDRARAAVAQPEVVAGVPGRRWARRVVTPAHLVVVTGRELTIVGDDPAAVRVTRTRHGAVWDHYRLGAVGDAAVGPAADDGMVRLTFGLPGGRVVESLFESSRRGALEALLALR